VSLARAMSHSRSDGVNVSSGHMGDAMEYHYDPESDVPAELWLSLDETDRVRLAEEHHKRAGMKAKARHLHAVFHVIAENQVAMGDAIEAEATLRRLMAEGLDRHDAIHAIAGVAAAHFHAAVKNRQMPADPNAAYNADLRRLKASEWLASWASREP